MRICLISPYPDITAFGLRTISACLKERGHETRMIFLPDPYGDNPKEGVERYRVVILEELVTLCKGSDLIGISLMTNFFDGAVQITEKIRGEVDARIIWGGVHPTVCPDECLEYADMVCVGEGEDVMVQLADGMSRKDSLSEIRGLWIRSGDTVIRNPLMPLARNLDIYPLPDYDLQGHYIISKGHIRPFTASLLRMFLEEGTVSQHLRMIGYQTMTGRGCPHKCSYCVNDTLKNLYSGQSYLRWRTAGHVMTELSWVKQNMPYVEFIWISDDSFFARTLKGLRLFAQEYKEKIGLPFSCLASPLTLTEEKMALLVDAGLCYLQMGIETGSRKIQEIFNRRPMSNEKMLKAIRIINRYGNAMFPPSYDFIMDVPYETDDDRIDTLMFISKIPKPFRLQPFSLVLYPGTSLYTQAREDGYMVNERSQVYYKSYSMREASYLGLLVSFAKFGRFPSPLLRFLISRPVVHILNARHMKPLFQGLFSFLKGMYRLAKDVKRGS